MNKIIGIVNCNKDNKIPNDLIQVLSHLDFNSFLISIDQDNYVETIKNSGIKYWIFTGSELNPKKTPQSINLSELKKLDKSFKFLMICYSMQKILIQLGLEPLKKKLEKKELEIPNDKKEITVSLKNEYYFENPDKKVKNLDIISTKDNVLMTAEYNGNILLTQWHPERTDDGIKFLKKWFK